MLPKLILALLTTVFLMLGADRTVQTEPELGYQHIATLIKSNQIVFRKDGDGYAPVCMCGPKLYFYEIPSILKHAVVAIEDKRFFSHRGFDPVGTFRAIGKKITRRRTEGGSTITQQLIKNTVLSSERSLNRKLNEANLSLILEAHETKDKILTSYLNQVGFGSYKGREIIGIAQASRHYFGRKISDLTLLEYAVLAGMLKGPNFYNPNRHWERARDRALLVLNAMLDQDYINSEQYERAISSRRREKGALKPVFPEFRNFVQWVLEDIENQFPDAVFTPKTRIPITLQVLSQDATERALHASTPNTQRRGGEYAFVSMYDTGEVIIMVGQRNFGKRPFNHATKSRRQPASTFKPFVYLAAMEEKKSPSFKAVHDALAISDNRLPLSLIRRVGPQKVAEVANRFGINTKMRLDNSLALGSSEVSLLDLTSAYNTISTSGFYAKPYGFNGIIEFGKIRYWRNPSNSKPVAKRTHLDEINKGLRRVVTHGAAKGLGLRNGISGKTGTSDQNRDA